MKFVYVIGFGLFLSSLTLFGEDHVGPFIPNLPPGNPIPRVEAKKKEVVFHLGMLNCKRKDTPPESKLGWGSIKRFRFFEKVDPNSEPKTEEGDIIHGIAEVELFPRSLDNGKKETSRFLLNYEMKLEKGLTMKVEVPPFISKTESISINFPQFDQNKDYPDGIEGSATIAEEPAPVKLFCKFPQLK